MSKAEKLRRHRAARDGMELAPVPRRDKNGCFSERTRQQKPKEPDPRQTVLSARARHLGKADTEENRLAMTGHMCGDPAGQAIQIGSSNPEEAGKLWDIFWKLDRVDAAYHARILGRGRHAKCGKVEYMPERFEARMDEASDHRTEEEKDRAAVNLWMRWHGFVGRLASQDQTAIWDGIYLRGDLQRRGALTRKGMGFLSALRKLADAIEAR